ncbi:MAG: hypothetical protein HOP19_15125 [Acidobacteria bacterium]|nr:hypothetical protein [Acidobacteriota bacterium]
MSEQIILGIPGTWKDASEVAQAIVQESQDLFFAGFTLMDATTQEVSFVEWHDHDPRLVDVFEKLGQPWINDYDLSQISRHRSTLWVLSSDVSIRHARQMMKLGQTLLQAGGLGVKVESSGVAHSAQRWQSLARGADATSPLYCAFVNLLEGSDYAYSCGMHNFGLPDVSLAPFTDKEAEAALMHQFNQYQIESLSEFQDGDLFSLSADAPPFRLHFEACDHFAPPHPLFNPFGRWHLTAQ